MVDTSGLAELSEVSKEGSGTEKVVLSASCFMWAQDA